MTLILLNRTGGVGRVSKVQIKKEFVELAEFDSHCLSGSVTASMTWYDCGAIEVNIKSQNHHV